MLIIYVWLVCAFGLISQTNTITANSTQAAITATSPDIEIDSSDAISDLEKAETKDAKNLEIIKQIRRVNNDGSYTVGYEAIDGTFKIESRDVLGNVKGTYGYVDENGEIKRVSYTANNTTNGLKSTPQPVEQISVPGRQNRTVYASSTSSSSSSSSLSSPPTTTRKPPSIAYLMSSTPSPLRVNTNVVQAIPKRRILLASSSQTPKHPFSSAASTTTTTTRKMELSTEPSHTKKADPTTTIVYATSIRSTVKPSTTTSVVEPSTVPRSSNSKKIEISDRFSKVLNMNNKNVKILEESSEQSETKSERKQLRGNALRRQLPSDQSENFESHSQIVYSQSSDEDSVHTYSGVTGTQRPVFSTTSSPRIPALVLAARNRAAMLKNAALQTTLTTEKVYAKPPRRKVSDRREESIPTTEQSAENEYLTQSPSPVQIPANSRDTTQNDNIAHVYRHPNGYLPRPREFLRQSQSSSSSSSSSSANTSENNNSNNDSNGPRTYKQVQSSAYVQNDVENEQYLRETSESSVKGSTASTPEHYTNSDLNAATQPILQSYHPRNQRLYGAQPSLRPNNINEYDQRLQQQQSIPLPVQPGYQPFYGGPVAPPYHNHPDRPLTARDFERLLNLLVIRHQQFQRLNYLPGLMAQNFFGGLGGLGYGGIGGGGGGGYFGGGYNPFGYPQVPRAPFYNQFDPRYTGFSRSLPPVPPPQYAPYSEQENAYQAQSPIESQQLPYMRRMPQPRQNLNQQYYATSESNDLAHQKVVGGIDKEYLPAEIREELLYRMLMLAIQADPLGMPSGGAIPAYPAPIPASDASTIQEYFKANAAFATTPDPIPKKPVRSVQILGEER